MNTLLKSSPTCSGFQRKHSLEKSDGKRSPTHSQKARAASRHVGFSRDHKSRVARGVREEGLRLISSQNHRIAESQTAGFAQFAPDLERQYCTERETEERRKSVESLARKGTLQIARILEPHHVLRRSVANPNRRVQTNKSDAGRARERVPSSTRNQLLREHGRARQTLHRS